MVWAGAVQTAAWSGAVVRTETDDYGQLRTKRTAETDWQGELALCGPPRGAEPVGGGACRWAVAQQARRG